MPFASIFGSSKENNNDYKNCGNGKHDETLPTVQAVPVPAPAASSSATATPQSSILPVAPPSPLIAYTPPSPQTTKMTTSLPATNPNHDFFLMLGRQPAMMHECPKCHATGCRTRVTTYPGFFSWLLVIGLLILVVPFHYLPNFMLPVAFLPLVFDKLKKSDHFCSKCNKKVGSVQPLSDCGVKHMT
mmetsp:Transcript_13644/g.27373  ORF Transcript_13644/g.27373 Transcript_13644/m.27373 type:complete len:187 (+) Transcript_13644:91-651(+)